ncbi:MAG: hypothetical protein DCC49_10205 [Acidobacteria bacterium]|nr:MAG: hypothetical protein DCC49_10205 [Acidobacteriota bacterium]
MTEQYEDKQSAAGDASELTVGAPVKQRSRGGRNIKLARLGYRHVAGNAWTRIRLMFARGDKREAILEARRMANSARLYETLGDMKGLMMKLGQIMSFVDETMPPEYRESLAQLQRAAPPMSPTLVHEVIRAELGAAPAKVFASFDDEPVASASIGQVHRATMHSGREVAVKVQYPGVDDAIRADLKNMKTLYALISMAWKNLDPEPVLAEVRERIWEELDYRYEAENQRRFHDIYRDHPFIRVPGVVDELSTRRILTQDYVRGRGFYEVLDDPQDLKNRYGEAIYRFVFGSMHMFGIFNGDPHPGNYFFHDDGSVTFVDYGAVKYFSESRMADLVAYVLAGASDDPAAFADALKRVGFLHEEHEKDVSIDELHRILSFHFDPIREDSVFTYSTSWAYQTFKQGFMPDKDELGSLKHMSLPPDLIMLNRIQSGLNSILGHLQATGNWHRISAEYHSGGPVDTELGRQAAEYFAEWQKGRQDIELGKRYLKAPVFSTVDSD